MAGSRRRPHGEGTQHLSRAGSACKSSRSREHSGWRALPCVKQAEWPGKQPYWMDPARLGGCQGCELRCGLWSVGRQALECPVGTSAESKASTPEKAHDDQSHLERPQGRHAFTDLLLEIPSICRQGLARSHSWCGLWTHSICLSAPRCLGPFAHTESQSLISFQLNIYTFFLRLKYNMRTERCR